MNLSEEWKSIWSISSVYNPPLLLHGQSAKPLGPLFFTSCSQTLNILLSSPCLLFDDPLPRISARPLIAPSLNPIESNEPTTMSNNNLQILRCPPPNANTFLIFFPTGHNLDRVGFVKLLSLEEEEQGSQPQLSIDECNIYVANQEFSCRILKISVTSSSSSGNSLVIGFLSATTLYAVHWYRVEMSKWGPDLAKPVLVYLGTKRFNNMVVHSCWSPHLDEECLVLLENGELYLFDMGDCFRVNKFPTKLKGTRINYSFNDFDSKDVWVSCEFTWHPRIFVVCSSSAVFLVDGWFHDGNVNILAKIEMFVLNHSIGNEKFIAFCKAGSNGFYYSVATDNYLFLLDTRKPMTPLLQWTHKLDNPRYINVFKLSELRSLAEEDDYKWATDSGFAILLGSFLSGEFNLFCYGPPSPVPHGSLASKVYNFSSSFYAWELPSKFHLSGNKCCCGDCLLREIFSNATFPPPRKERILGFCIITQPKPNGLSGFTLIRLVSSGRLESQQYHASWDCCGQELNKSRVKNSLPCFLGDEKYKFVRRFRYLNLDYLLGYLNGDLSSILLSKVQNPPSDAYKTMSFTQNRCKLICDMLKAGGVDSLGSPPAIANVTDTIGCPMSIHEVASNRIWAGLTVDLLQLAFTARSDVLDALVDHRTINLDFIDIPDMPQMPPFSQKTPSSRSNKVSHKKPLKNDLVGPLLPLPLLLTLREVDVKNCLASENEVNKFSTEEELTHQCDVVKRAANDMLSSESCPGLNDSCLGLDGSGVVSLANDGEEKWVGSKEPTSLLFYKPTAFSGKNKSNKDISQEDPIYEDEKFDTFIAKRRVKHPTTNPPEEAVGIEMFDDLCPIKLNFDFSPMKFDSKDEVKAYKLLHRQFSKWQQDCKPYQDFLATSNIQVAGKKPSPRK